MCTEWLDQVWAQLHIMAARIEDACLDAEAKHFLVDDVESFGDSVMHDSTETTASQPDLETVFSELRPGVEAANEFRKVQECLMVDKWDHLLERCADILRRRAQGLDDLS